MKTDRKYGVEGEFSAAKNYLPHSGINHLELELWIIHIRRSLYNGLHRSEPPFAGQTFC